MCPELTFGQMVAVLVTRHALWRILRPDALPDLNLLSVCCWSVTGNIHSIINVGKEDCLVDVVRANLSEAGVAEFWDHRPDSSPEDGRDCTPQFLFGSSGLISGPAAGP